MRAAALSLFVLARSGGDPVGEACPRPRARRRQQPERARSPHGRNHFARYGRGLRDRVSFTQPENVTEDHPLVPLTLYNKFKGMCEPVLFKHQAPDFTCVTIRPATVCGYSPRMRLDLSVNILTNLAVNQGKITVFGGNQLRPNLHRDVHAP